MNLSKIKALYAKEMRDAFRDPSTILTVFIIPLILFPLLFLVSGSIMNRMEKAEQKLIPEIVITDIPETQSIVTLFKNSPKVQVVYASDPIADLEGGKILAFIEAPSNTNDRLLEEKSAEIKVFYDETNRMSIKAKDIVSRILKEYEEEMINQRLTKRALDRSLLTAVRIETISVSSEQRRGGFLLGILVPYILIVLLYSASMNTATDITAGEKERKTIETLLTSNIGRKEIVFGKIGAVMTVGLLSTIMGLCGLILSFYTGFSILTAATDIKLIVAPIPVLFSFLLLLPVAGLFSAMLLMIGCFARSVKECSSYANYILIVVVLLAMVSVLRRGAAPSIESFLVPVMNTTFVQQELLMGIINWPHIGLTVLTTGILALIAFIFAVYLFLNERILFRQ